MHVLIEHLHEILARDFLPGFAGYWLHTVNSGGWRRLSRFIGVKGGH